MTSGQRRLRQKDPPPGGFSRKRLSGFVAPSVTARWGDAPSAAPRHTAFSSKTGPHGILKQALTDPGGYAPRSRLASGRNSCAIPGTFIPSERLSWRSCRFMPGVCALGRMLAKDNADSADYEAFFSRSKAWRHEAFLRSDPCRGTTPPPASPHRAPPGLIPTSPVATWIRRPITKTYSRFENRPPEGGFGAEPLPGRPILPARPASSRHPCRATCGR